MEDEEGEEFGEFNYNNSRYLNRRAARPAGSGSLHGSASQVSLSFGSQRSVGSGRSHSLGIMSMAHRQSSSDHLHHASVGGDNIFKKANETFFLGSHFPLPSAPSPRGGTAIGGGVGNANGNPLLELLAKLSAATVAAPPSPVLQPPQGVGASSLASALATATAAAAGAASVDPNDRQNSCSRAASVSSEEDTSAMAGAFSTMMRTTRHRSASASRARCGGSPPPPAPASALAPSASSAAATTTTSGPSELYRLIASPPPPGGDPPDYWDAVLNRANEHPHEACFYDPNAGGHVYALHRLLRRTTWGEEDDEDNDDHEDDPEDCDDDRLSGRQRRRQRPPVSVVEAVMRACPRAVTRKQAVVDEDALLAQSSSATTRGGGDDGNVLRRMSPPPLPLLPAPEGDDEGGAGGRGPSRRANAEDEEDVADADDVRFEYPLAIACECQQDGEVVRLLASYLGTAAPAYRSEVYRSLDYASLPNHAVRILLEEHAGCVVERGTNSEATEGDDDDCPLEQVLFWWDDPDMMGMEDEILSYPNCDMVDDLRDLWEKLRMMLYAATYGKMEGYDDSKGSFQVLHRLMRIGSTGGIGGVHFPNDFAHAVLLLAKFIQRERRSMFEERDETGSLPLHIAVSGDSLLRQNDYPPRTMGTGKDDERAEDGAAAVDRGDATQYESDAQIDHEMGGVVRAGDGDLAAGGEAGQLNNGPLLPLAGGLVAGAVLAEEDEDDEEDSEAGDNGEEEDNEDIDTSAMPSDMELIRLLLDQYPASIRLRDSQSGSLPIHLILRHNPRAIDAIELFLDLYPRSVTMPDGDGRLPIHLAMIQKSPTWNKVLSMSPIALETRDPVTGLLPFQLAAMSKPAPKDDMEGPTGADQQDQDQDELESLSTCYRLLRMSPCLASGLLDTKPQSPIEQQIMVRCKPRVTKLEEENERLRRRVEELELKLASMQMAEMGVLAIPSGCPLLKKRKSSAPS
jgi:hypothetical protein